MHQPATPIIPFVNFDLGQVGQEMEDDTESESSLEETEADHEAAPEGAEDCSGSDV